MTVGQRELFVPAPTRRIIRWRSETGWAGVDPSTKRCAIATVSPAGVREVRTVSFPGRLAGPERLHAIYEGVAEAWGDVASEVAYVAVEQPSGAKQNPELVYAVGVTLAAIASVDCLEAPVIETVASSKWKKLVCGHGGIKKPKPSETREYEVLTWARENGYGATSWDEADAWAIAEWARRTVSIDRR